MQTEHSIRKPVAARQALDRRKRTLALGILLALGIAGVLALLLVSCGGGAARLYRRPSFHPSSRCKSRMCRESCRPR